MGEIRHKRPVVPITRKWAFLVGISTSPLFILSIYFHDPGRGQTAWIGAMMIALAVRFFWDLREHVWFWTTIAFIVLLHVPLILLIPWPLKQLSYVALLPAGLVDFGVAYGIIRLVENAIESNGSLA